jgi:peptidoglycan/LPS O-acetylase OafA/YrhL
MIRDPLRDRHPDEGVRAGFGHIGAIEGLRGVAVLWVMAFHYVVLRSGRFDDPWLAVADAARPLQVVLGNGYLGVDLFFLITGFLLTLPWFRRAAEGRPAPSTRDFYVRRVRRIVPAYYVQLVVLFALFVPLLLGPGFWRNNLYFMGFNIPAHALFLHYTTPISSASLGVNGALWTLALEFQYYLLLPLLAPWFVRAPLRTALAFAAAALLWRWQSAHGLDWLVAIQMRIGAPWSLPESTIRQLIATQLPGYLAHFAIGIVLGRAWLAPRSPAGPRGQAAWLAAAAVALGIVYYLLAFGPRVLGDFSWILVPLGLAVAMHALVTRAPAVGSKLLANPPIAFVGRVSYSAYLYHLPLLLLWNRYGPQDPTWLGLPAYLGVALFVAWISWRAIERPFMRSSRSAGGSTWPTSAAPGASEAPNTSATTTTNGAGRSTTTGSTSNS